MGKLISDFIGVFNSFGWIIAVAIYVIICVARYFLFTRAGEEGWKAFVPVYSTIIDFRVMDTEDNLFSWLLTGGLFCLIAYFMVDPLNLTWVMILMLVMAIVLTVIFFVIKNMHGAKRFGLDLLYGIGLTIVPFVFYPLLILLGKDYNKNL